MEAHNCVGHIQGPINVIEWQPNSVVPQLWGHINVWDHNILRAINDRPWFRSAEPTTEDTIMQGQRNKLEGHA